MDQWVSDWEVVALSKLAEDFSHCPSLCRFHARDQLDLNVSLRNHLAQDASTFMNLLIAGEIDQAKALSPSLKAAGYTMLVTQDLDAALRRRQSLCRYKHPKYGYCRLV